MSKSDKIFKAKEPQAKETLSDEDAETVFQHATELQKSIEDELSGYDIDICILVRARNDKKNANVLITESGMIPMFLRGLIPMYNEVTRKSYILVSKNDLSRSNLN